MAPTRWRLLVLVAAVAGLIGWAAVRLVDALAGSYLPIAWTAASAVWLMAVALLTWTLLVRPRLLRLPGREPLAPTLATRTAALALASSRGGAGVAGAYAGVLLGFLAELSNPAGRQSAVIAGVTAVGAVVIVAVALWLESLCRIDEDDDEQTQQTERPGGLGSISAEPAEWRGGDRAIAARPPVRWTHDGRLGLQRPGRSAL